MAIQNNCANCQKMSSCKLRHDIIAVLTPYREWFSDSEEVECEICEALGKQCTKFLENGG